MSSGHNKKCGSCGRQNCRCPRRRPRSVTGMALLKGSGLFNIPVGGLLLTEAGTEDALSCIYLADAPIGGLAIVAGGGLAAVVPFPGYDGVYPNLTFAPNYPVTPGGIQFNAFALSSKTFAGVVTVPGGDPLEIDLPTGVELVAQLVINAQRAVPERVCAELVLRGPLTLPLPGPAPFQTETVTAPCVAAAGESYDFRVCLRNTGTAPVTIGAGALAPAAIEVAVTARAIAPAP